MEELYLSKSKYEILNYKEVDYCSRVCPFSSNLLLLKANTGKARGYIQIIIHQISVAPQELPSVVSQNHKNFNFIENHRHSFSTFFRPFPQTLAAQTPPAYFPISDEEFYVEQ